jgi:RNA polymerase sigma-70 factor (ECF subfamily)
LDAPRLIYLDVDLLSDEQLVKRILAGRTDEFRDLMRRHENAVFRLACRMLGRREEAEDAAQEAFLRVYQNLAQYEGRGQFWPWVRRITVNICLRRIPREIPDGDIEAMVDAKCSEQDPVVFEVMKGVESGQVRRIVAGLPALYRTAIILRYEEDLSCNEIAEVLGESLSAVKSRLFRAERMLAERLQVVMKDGML